MKRNEIKQEYYKETGEYWKGKNGMPTIEYVNWIEDKIKKQ